jgi:uncharacterized membrane protein YsdA (DUF1294 family)
MSRKASSRTLLNSAQHPFMFYAVLFLGLTLAGALAIWWVLRWELVTTWIIAITVVALFAYRYDKRIAGSDHMRIPERVLHLLALAGGTIGALAGMWFVGERHKTNKRSFVLPLLVILFFQLVVVGIYLWVRFNGF